MGYKIIISLCICKAYNQRRLRFNIYEIQGYKFVNILNKPIYHRIEKSNSKQRLDIQPEETIMLKRKKN